MFFRILVVLMIFCFTKSPLFANRDEGMAPADGFFLPQGNAKTGEQAFGRLKCNSCHWVQNNIDLNVPVAEKVGPMLGSK